MKLKITWLESILSRWGASAPSDPESVNPNKPDLPKEIDLGIDLPEDLQEFLIRAPMPDVYSDEFEATVPDLRIIEPSASDADKETGFNPYDTARMQKNVIQIWSASHCMPMN